ncbi:hypothetical protein [Yinghuangia soli]|uniref:Integrase n=1 Tax=Yinghuangia soli TaxID=2908204 RepID=A0AA41Q175_9ACTN|nr:hypothetical protein [Yinghuangia soli]MCF2528906.1 hypothetical protein [Yinghuangia soli]MCF2533562.1 hypothetical protein [Yinghuangia soli]
MRELTDEAGELVYGLDDSLPDLVGAWIASLRSDRTRHAYARAFVVWEEYVRARGVHPLRVDFPLADSFAGHLKTARSLKQVGGGGNSGAPARYAPVGPPYQPTTQTALLSGVRSFYVRVVRRQGLAVSPFAFAELLAVSPLGCGGGNPPSETALLIQTARQYSRRAFALCTMLYLIRPRMGELLARDVEHLGYDRGHHTLPFTAQDGRTRPVPIPPLAWHALDLYLGGRNSGPLFMMHNRRRVTEDVARKCLRDIAMRAELPDRPDMFAAPANRYPDLADRAVGPEAATGRQEAIGESSMRRP